MSENIEITGTEAANTLLNSKLRQTFDGKIVRKDLTKKIKEGANVPVYVLEFLLGQYCSSDDPDVIETGVSNVKRILAENYVRPDEAQKILSVLRQRGSYTVIDKITVNLNIKKDSYEAEFSNLGIKNIPISETYPTKFDRLLCGGIWCIVQLEYEYIEEEKNTSPIRIHKLTPIQMPHVDLEELKQGRKAFTQAEWMNLLLRSIGMEPEKFNEREKWLLLARMLPLVENNFNLCELGPRSTGKSHIYKEISPNRKTVGIPGTGLYYTTHKSWQATKQNFSPVAQVPKNDFPPNDERLKIPWYRYIILSGDMKKFWEAIQAFYSGRPHYARALLQKIQHLPDAQFILAIAWLNEKEYTNASVIIENIISQRYPIGKQLEQLRIPLTVRMDIEAGWGMELPGSRTGVIIAGARSRQQLQRETEALDLLFSDPNIQEMLEVQLLMADIYISASDDSPSGNRNALEEAIRIACSVENKNEPQPSHRKRKS